MADTNFTDLATLTLPQSGFYLLIEDTTQVGINQMKKIALNDLISLITLGITDKVVRMEEVASPTSASSNAGALHFESASHVGLQTSQNGTGWDTVCTLTATQTLANKTLTSPTFPNDFSNAHHDHSNSANGGALGATGVSAASYKSCSLTVSGDGRITAAHNGFTDGPVTLSYSGSNINTDASVSDSFTITLNHTLTSVIKAPSNGSNGQICLWEIVQDSTGSCAVSVETGVSNGFAFGDQITSLTFSTGMNKRDFMTAWYCATNSRWYIVGFETGYLTS
jgi:hypothetical protein